MGYFNNAYINVKDSICNFIGEDDVSPCFLDEIDELLSNMDCAEYVEWMGRFATGIKLLAVSTPYDADDLWGLLASCIKGGFEGDEPIEEIWESFKAVANEHDF